MKDSYKYNPEDFQKMFGKDARFYRELAENQNFQYFIQNYLKNTIDYSLFKKWMLNVQEKYIIKNDNEENLKSEWKEDKKLIRQIKDLNHIPIEFELPEHISNICDNTIHNYNITYGEWAKINSNTKICSNTDSIIPENKRVSNVFTEIKHDNDPKNDSIKRYFFPLKEGANYNSDINVEFPKDEKEEGIVEGLKKALNSIIKRNENVDVKNYLDYIKYRQIQNIIIKALYVRGFKPSIQLSDDCFNSLYDIFLQGLKIATQLEPDQFVIEFVQILTSSAFNYINSSGVDLISKLKAELGDNYFFWNKEYFLNCWLNLEGYCLTHNYKSFCDIIKNKFISSISRLTNVKCLKNYFNKIMKEQLELLIGYREIDEKEIPKYEDILVMAKIK